MEVITREPLSSNLFSNVVSAFRFYRVPRSGELHREIAFRMSINRVGERTSKLLLDVEGETNDLQATPSVIIS